MPRPGEEKKLTALKGGFIEVAGWASVFSGIAVPITVLICLHIIIHPTELLRGEATTWTISAGLVSVLVGLLLLRIAWVTEHAERKYTLSCPQCGATMQPRWLKGENLWQCIRCRYQRRDRE